MSVIQELCGEQFFVYENGKIGKCFKELCLIYPSFCALLIVSSYFIGYRNARRVLRSRFEVAVVCIRAFLSLLFSVLSAFALSELLATDIILVDLIKAIVILTAWIVHTFYLWSLINGITYKIRGPIYVNVCFSTCFVVSALSLYFECRNSNLQCLKLIDILSISFYLIYIVTLLPRNAQQSEHVSPCNINIEDSEQEPLINSVSCRYYAFHEEIDPDALGVAEQSSNICSRLFFTWVKPLMLKGYYKNIRTVDDLFDLPVELQASYLYDRASSKICSHISYYNTQSLSKPSHLIKELHKCFAWEFYCIGLLKFISDILSFGGPILLNNLVSCLEADGEIDENGYIYVLGLFLITFFSALCSTHYNYLITNLGIKVKATLIMTVYRKTLHLNKMVLSGITSGEILNFISTDTDRIVNICQSFHQFWSLPVQVIIALVLLYQQVNYCFFVGVIFMIIVIPINQYIAKKIANFSSLMMKAKDKRIKMMNEILNGIRIIKMNTWEAIFFRKLNVAREHEIKFLKKRKYLDALCVYFWATTPVIMSFLTFSLYASLGHKLTASKVFTSIALFNILIMPLNAFPWVLNGLMEAWISLKRVNIFLQLPILELSDYYSKPSCESVKLEIVDGQFSFSECTREVGQTSNENSDNTKADLNGSNIGPINLKIMQGNFICIIGKVGSGKSSLLSSILADMNCVNGEVKLDICERNKGIGYVSQEPWIQQKSIKDNILFGRPLNSLKYRSVLEACALLDDFKLFSHGDNTQVGDKGVTLSGGQKARIALARAVYQDFDIYLLDDPFSAVDAHVAEHIFSNCIMGLLKGKTRVLCTHKTKFAENADYVIIISDGKVSSQCAPSQALQLYFMNNEEIDVEDFKEEKNSSSSVCCENKQFQIVSEEEKEEGVVKFHIYKSYWKAVGSSLSVSVLLFCFLMQASRTTSDWWLSFWVSSVKNQSISLLNTKQLFATYSDQRHSITFYLYVYGGIALANSIFTLFRAFLFALSGITAAITIHDRLFRTIIKAAVSFFDVTPVGRIINRFSSDIYCIDDSLPFILNILLAQVFSLIGCIIITCYGLPWILVLILVLSFIYFKTQRYYRYTSRELKRLSSISLSPIYAHFSETLSGHSTIRAMASNTRFEKDNMDRLDSNIRAILSMNAASQWLNLRLQFIGVLIVTGVAMISMLQKEFGDVDAGLVGLALSYALSITSLLNGSITAFIETEKEIVSVERVMQYVEGIKTETEEYLQMPPFAWPSHGVVTFVNVSLQYRPTCPYAIRNISFETRPAEKVGIVGRTGSGKSSLIQILCRLVDFFEGSVFIDGVNIAHLELKKLRSNLSIIPQDPFLFSGSIRENLDPNYLRSDGEIWKALRFCHMEDKVHNLGGLDEEIDEKGQNFSAGEKQLICLTRALLQRSKILCMDEATANIDYQTDSLIRHAIRMAFRHSTILIIAHRMETIMDCDRIIVMNEGHILEIDKPSNLLADSKSEFYSFVYNKKICSQ